MIRFLVNQYQKNMIQPEIIQLDQYTSVSRNFTSKSHYKSVVECAQQREAMFQEFVQFLVRSNEGMKQCCHQLHYHDHLLFNDHIRDDFELINECWSEQLGRFCNSQIAQIDDVSHNPQYQLQSFKLQYIQEQAYKFETLQEQLIKQIQGQKDKTQTILNRYEKSNIEREKTLNFFNSSYLTELHEEISKLHNFIEEANKSNKSQIHKLEKMKRRFLSIFESFKRTAVKNHQLFEKKFYKVCKIAIEGIIKTFPQFQKKLKSIRQQIAKIPSSTYPNENRDQSSMGFISSDDIFSICSHLKSIRNVILSILEKFKNEREKFCKNLSAFPIMEGTSTNQALRFVLQTLQKAFSRFSQISSNVTRRIKTLEKQQAKSNRLGRSTNESNQQFLNNLRTKKIDYFEKSFTVQVIMDEILEDMVNPFFKLAVWVQEVLKKQRNTFFQEPTSCDNKAFKDIHQEEMWMFDGCKSQNIMRLHAIAQVKDKLHRTKQQIEAQNNTEGQEIMEPQRCEIFEAHDKSRNGVLHLYNRCIKFIISESSHVLTIPYQQIMNVKVKLDFFKMNVVIYTNRGKIIFLNPPKALKIKDQITCKIQKRDENLADDINNNRNLSMSPTQKNAKNQINNKVEQSQVAISNNPKKKYIELTTDQIQGMNAWRTKVLAETPDTKNWNKKGIISTVLKNVSVDQIYYYGASDKEQDVYGKNFQTFNSYALTSMGMTNVQDGKFDKSGPRFFTREGNNTFLNSPIYSQRICSFQKEITDLAIPMVPKSVKISETFKIYWVSNQELTQVREASCSEIPLLKYYIKSFVCISEYKNNGDDVELSTYFGINWIKDTVFKSLVEKSYYSQIHTNYVKMKKIQTDRINQIIQKRRNKKPQIAFNQKPELPKVQPIQKNLDSDKTSKSNLNVIYLTIGILSVIILMKIIL